MPAVSAIAQRYESSLRALFPDADFVTDKRPDNFIYIGLIKMLATPLILFVVLDALLRSSLKAKSGFRIVVISMINGAFALAIAISMFVITFRR